MAGNRDLQGLHLISLKLHLSTLSHIFFKGYTSLQHSHASILYFLEKCPNFMLSKSLFQDGAEHGSRVASSEKTLQFFVCFICYFVVLCVGCC